MSRRLFATRGYAAVGLAEIVREAGVTKGALYHHFEGGKTDLFRAVLAQVQAEVARTVAADRGRGARPVGAAHRRLPGLPHGEHRPGRPPDHADRRARGTGLERVARDGRSRVGEPSRRFARRPDSRPGSSSPQPVAPLARLLSGAMNEAALWLAETGDPADLDAVLAALFRMLEALRG